MSAFVPTPAPSGFEEARRSIGERWLALPSAAIGHPTAYVAAYALMYCPRRRILTPEQIRTIVGEALARRASVNADAFYAWARLADLKRMSLGKPPRYSVDGKQVIR